MILHFPRRPSGGRFMTLAAELAPYLRQRRGVSAATVWYRVRLALFAVVHVATVIAVVLEAM